MLCTEKPRKKKKVAKFNVREKLEKMICQLQTQIHKYNVRERENLLIEHILRSQIGKNCGWKVKFDMESWIVCISAY